MKQRDFEFEVLELLNLEGIKWTDLVIRFKGMVSEQNCRLWINHMAQQEYIYDIKNYLEKSHGALNRLDEIKEERIQEQKKEIRESKTLLYAKWATIFAAISTLLWLFDKFITDN